MDDTQYCILCEAREREKELHKLREFVEFALSVKSDAYQDMLRTKAESLGINNATH
jgi:hypothetical protein